MLQYIFEFVIPCNVDAVALSAFPGICRILVWRQCRSGTSAYRVTD